MELFENTVEPKWVRHLAEAHIREGHEGESSKGVGKNVGSTLGKNQVGGGEGEHWWSRACLTKQSEQAPRWRRVRVHEGAARSNIAGRWPHGRHCWEWQEDERSPDSGESPPKEQQGILRSCHRSDEKGSNERCYLQNQARGKGAWCHSRWLPAVPPPWTNRGAETMAQAHQLNRIGKIVKEMFGGTKPFETRWNFSQIYLNIIFTCQKNFRIYLWLDFELWIFKGLKTDLNLNSF